MTWEVGTPEILAEFRSRGMRLGHDLARQVACRSFSAPLIK
jgi:hypothetical protein